jgi:hypothetical protein
MGHSWESAGFRLTPHPTSLRRVVNGSLRERISGGRMTQSGRLATAARPPRVLSTRFCHLGMSAIWARELIHVS